MREGVWTPTLWTDFSKHSTQPRMTVWESDYASVAPLSRDIRVVYGQRGMMVPALRSHSQFLGDPTARPAPSVIVACGRLLQPIRMRQEIHESYTFTGVGS